jgi:hypothetical protein
VGETPECGFHWVCLEFQYDAKFTILHLVKNLVISFHLGSLCYVSDYVVLVLWFSSDFGAVQ